MNDKPYSDSDRKKIIALLNKKLDECGGAFLLGSIKNVFDSEGLELKASPKTWLKEEFGEHFDIYGTNGREVITTAGSPLIRAHSFITKQALTAGFVYISDIGNFFAQNPPYSWRENNPYGLSFPEWCKQHFPEYTINPKDINTLIPYTRCEPAVGKSPSATKFDALRNIAYNYVFLPYANTFKKMLHGIDPDCGIDETEFRAVCQERIEQYLLGNTDGFFCFDDKIAFDMQFKTSFGKEIYCILGRNTNVGHYQKYTVEALDCPAEDSELGKLLQSKCAVKNDVSANAAKNTSEAERLVNELHALRSALSDALPEVQSALESERALPESFVDDVRAYSDGWSKLNSLISESELPLEDNRASLTDIGNMLSSDRNRAAVLRTRASEKFSQISKSVRKNLSELLHSQSGSAEEDIAKWEKALSSEDYVSQINELLTPYRALADVCGYSAELSERSELSRLLDLLDEIKQFLGNGIKAGEALNLLTDNARNILDINGTDLSDALDELCKLVSLAHKADCAAENNGFAAALPVLSPIELIAGIADGTADIADIHASFTTPDEADRAIIVGNTDKIKEILADENLIGKYSLSEADCAALKSRSERDLAVEPNEFITMASAGLRLLTVPGKRSRAEHILLVGLALNEQDVFDVLFRLYSEDNRSEELLTLFNFFRNVMPSDIRRKYLSALVGAEGLDIIQAMENDIAFFLAPQFRERIHSVGLPDKYIDILSSLCEDLNRSRFAGYVIDDGIELRNFVASEESMAAVKSAGCTRDATELLALIRNDSYTKGKSVISTAERAFEFMGTWLGITDKLMMLSSDIPRRNALKLKILNESGDKRGMLELLKSDNLLKEHNSELYAALLFELGEYDEYYRVASEIPADSPRKQLMLAISAPAYAFADNAALAHISIGRDKSEAELAMTLARKLAENELFEPLFDLQTTCFVDMAMTVSEDTLREFVTIGGKAQELQQYAYTNGSIVTAVYCSQVLGIERERRAETADELYRSLFAAALNSESDSIEESTLLNLLFADRLSDSRNELERSRILAAVRSAKDSEEIPDELIRFTETASGLRTLLELCDEHTDECDEFITKPQVQAKIIASAEKNGMISEVRDFFHRHRECGDDEYRSFICGLYFDALLNGSISEETQLQAEDFIFRHADKPNITAAVCVCLIERNRGRTPFEAFALYCLMNVPAWNTDSEIYRSLEERRSELIGANEQVFSSLLYEVIEYGGGNIEGLDYARRIALLTAVTSSLSAGGGSVYNSTQKLCAEWYIKNGRADLLIKMLIDWLEFLIGNTAKWYGTKGFVAVIDKLTREQGGFLESEAIETKNRATSLFCELFNIINNNIASDENHNLLRSLIEFANYSNSEEAILSNKAIMDELKGVHLKLGLVFAIILMQSGKYETASRILNQINSLLNILYKDLIRDLAAKSPKELEEYCTSGGIDMLSCLLPDGNIPNITDIRSLVIRNITENTCEKGARTAENLLTLSPSDGVLYTALFILGRRTSDGIYNYNYNRIFLALMGIYRCYKTVSWLDKKTGIVSTKDCLWDYTRKRHDVLKLAAITFAVKSKLDMEKRKLAENNDSTINEAESLDIMSIKCSSDDEIQKNVSRIFEEAEQWSVPNSTTKSECDLIIRRVLNSYDGFNADYWECLWMSCVTAEWESFWDMVDIHNFTAAFSEITIFPAHHLKKERPTIPLYLRYGMMRGLLAMLNKLDTEHRRLYIEVMKSQIIAVPRNQINRASLDFIFSQLENVSRNSYADIGEMPEMLFKLPWEEHLVTLGEWKETDEYNRFTYIPGDSCFNWVENNISSEQLENSLRFASFLCNDSQSIDDRLYDKALTLVSKREFDTAKIYLDTLETFTDRFMEGQYYNMGWLTDERKKERFKDKRKLNKERISTLRGKIPAEAFSAESQPAQSLANIESYLGRAAESCGEQPQVGNQFEHLLNTAMEYMNGENFMRGYEAFIELALHWGNQSNPLVKTLYIENIPVALDGFANQSDDIDVFAEHCCSHSESYTILSELYSQNRNNNLLFKMIEAQKQLGAALLTLKSGKTNNSNALREAYSMAKAKLDQVEINPTLVQLCTLKATLTRRTSSALSKLGERPALNIKIYNAGSEGGCCDAIFGEIANPLLGSRTVCDIEVLVSISAGGRNCSHSYSYPDLRSGDKVLFDFRYNFENMDMSVKELRYEITVTYNYTVQNKSESGSISECGTLALKELQPAEYTITYTPNQAIDWMIDQNNNVVSKNGKFIGRKDLLKSFRDIVDGKSFSDYPNVIVQGIRRSGKTSLLKYFLSYVKASCPDTLPVWSDCEGIKVNPINAIFIENTRRITAQKFQGIEELDEWKKIEEWKVNSSAEGCQNLVFYFKDLKAAIDKFRIIYPSFAAKSIVLIIDEFHTMLNTLQSEDTGLDLILLANIRRIIQDPDCSEFMRFVLCGSNDLMVYRISGGKYSQAFQVFKTIEVDTISHNDLAELVRTQPDVVITDEAVSWLERYTGGLIWYSLLLAEKMLENALEDGRAIVYPNDVQRATTALVFDYNQFYEGMGENEKAVVSEMCIRTTRYNSYVSLEQLCEIFGEKQDENRLTGEQICASLRILEELKLITMNEADRNSYRFKRDIYRLHFREDNKQYITSEFTAYEDVLKENISISTGSSRFR